MKTSCCHLAILAVSGDIDAEETLHGFLADRSERYIIAVDFDGTLCHNQYPEIGAPYEAQLSALRLLQRFGACIILWTCRESDELAAALSWLHARKLVFDEVNDNSDEIKKKFMWNSRKIYADEYWDDKAVMSEKP